MINNTMKNLMLDELKSNMTHLALFDGEGNEITGGDPSYARKEITWGSSSNGNVAMTGTLEFNVPPSTTVASIRGFSALANGVEYSNFPITAEVYGNQGLFTVNSLEFSLTDSE